MEKKRVEIIDVKLDLNIADEIRLKVDSLSSDIIEHTKEVVKKSAMKIQRVNKRKQVQQQRDETVEKILDILVEASKTPEYWLEGKDIVEAVGVEPTSQNINKLSLQVRKHLEKEDKWILNKKRHMGKTLYRLSQFS